MLAIASTDLAFALAPTVYSATVSIIFVPKYSESLLLDISKRYYTALKAPNNKTTGSPLRVGPNFAVLCHSTDSITRYTAQLLHIVANLLELHRVLDAIAR